MGKGRGCWICSRILRIVTYQGRGFAELFLEKGGMGMGVFLLPFISIIMDTFSLVYCCSVEKYRLEKTFDSNRYSKEMDRWLPALLALPRSMWSPGYTTRRTSTTLCITLVMYLRTAIRITHMHLLYPVPRDGKAIFLHAQLPIYESLHLHSHHSPMYDYCHPLPLFVNFSG